MLTSTELNSIQGLLHYLNENVKEINVSDFDLTVETAEGTKTLATIGQHEDSGGDYVLKAIH